MRSYEGILCLAQKHPPPTVVAVTPWTSAEEGEFEFSFSADWWATWWVNGRRIDSTFGARVNRAWGLPLYYAAQLLIAWSIAASPG